MTYEGLRLKVQEIFRKKFSNFRKKKIAGTDFTIISNNCWGGMIYESYGLPKNSPTIGLFFMPDDYINFLRNLKEYLQIELVFIQPENSKYKKILSDDKRFGNYPIGKLQLNDEESIEVFFLHYYSEEEAKQKWERRKERINWEHILFKFNDQNGCTEKHIREFSSLPYKHKICFVAQDYKYNSVIKIKTPKSHQYIRASYEPFGKNKSYDVNELINSIY